MGRRRPSGGSRPSGRPLPRGIKVPLADLRRHYEAVLLVLERTSLDEFVSAADLADPELLARSVYPIERGFEILCNYVAELNELALKEAGIQPGDRPTTLRLVEREGVISSRRRRKLGAAFDARNRLQHEYPDVHAAGVYQAARDLVAELPGYAADYAAWLRRLGFGGERE